MFTRCSLSTEFSNEIKESFAMMGAQDQGSESYPDDHLPEFRTSMKQMRKDCDSMVVKLLNLFGKTVTPKDDKYYSKTHQAFSDTRISNVSTLRTHFYPPVGADAPVNSTRCGPHSDYGTFTLLFQDSMGGLEVSDLAQKVSFIIFMVWLKIWSSTVAQRRLKTRKESGYPQIQ